MTIPSSDTSLADINAALNRSPGTSVDFATHVYSVSGGYYDLNNAKGKVKDYYALFKMDGNNGSTSISDYTKTFNTVTTPTYISTATSVFGGASYYTSDHTLTTTVGISPTNINLSSYSGDWTLEGWFRFGWGAAAYGGVSRFITSMIGTYDSSIRLQGSELHAYYFEPPYNYFRSIQGSYVSQYNWYHFAFVKNGNTLYLFLNGSLIGTTWTDSNAVSMTSVGFGCGGGENFQGYLDEIRFSRIARYTSNFSVPSSSYD